MCELCGGIGLVLVMDAGCRRVSRECVCQAEARQRNRLARVGIPAAFAAATLDNFEPPRAVDICKALGLARRYVDEFIPGQTKTGLLFWGSTGTGKTHLAVGVARQLAEQKGIDARFVNMGGLLTRMRAAMFDKDPPESRSEILRPIEAAELVVLDDLAAARGNDLVFEIVETLIGNLYNDQRAVIVTTNMLNQPYDPKTSSPTLGERIGERAFSRLQQMCRGIEMSGLDWRRQSR